MGFEEDKVLARQPVNQHKMKAIVKNDWFVHFSRAPVSPRDEVFVGFVVGEFNDSGYIDCEVYSRNDPPEVQEIHVSEIDAKIMGRNRALMLAQDVSDGNEIVPFLENSIHPQIQAALSTLQTMDGFKRETYYPLDAEGFHG